MVLLELATEHADVPDPGGVQPEVPVPRVGRVREDLVDQVRELRPWQRVGVDRDQPPAFGAELALLATEPLVDDLRGAVVSSPAATRGDALAQLGDDLQQHWEQRLGGWLSGLAPERHDRRVDAAVELAEAERLDRKTGLGEHAGQDLGLPRDCDLGTPTGGGRGEVARLERPRQPTCVTDRRHPDPLRTFGAP